MRHNFTILLLAVLLLASCNPLRKVQRNQKADSTVVDRSEIRKAVTDILRESGTFAQTVVEFYPPSITPPKDKHVPEQSGLPTGNDTAFPATMQPQPAAPAVTSVPLPAVKRIIRTEIAAEREHETTTDSTAHKDIRAESRSELAEKVAEKPPAATITVKWIAIALAAIAAIILLLKIPKIKLPRI